MHAGRSTGQRHIQSVVDDHARRRPFAESDGFSDQRGEDRGVEIALSNLQEVNAGVDGESRLPNQARARQGWLRRRPAQAPAVGDEMNDQGPASLSARSVTGTSADSRTANIGASSANPAKRLTNPSPVTAPRMK
jgi:hypothetical protein